MKIRLNESFYTFVSNAGNSIECLVNGDKVLMQSQVMPGVVVEDSFDLVDTSDALDFSISRDVAKLLTGGSLLAVKASEDELSLCSMSSDMTYYTTVKTSVRAVFTHEIHDKSGGQVLEWSELMGLIYNANKYKTNVYVQGGIAWCRPHNLLSIAEQSDLPDLCIPQYLCSILVRNRDAKLVMLPDALEVQLGNVTITQDKYRVMPDEETAACFNAGGELFSVRVNVAQILSTCRSIPKVQSVLMNFGGLEATIVSDLANVEVTVGFGISECTNLDAMKATTFSLPLDFIAGLPKDCEYITIFIYKYHSMLTLGSMRFFYAR